jgi:hypothetical protein
MDQNFSMDQFSSYDYYGGGTDNYSIGSKGRPFFAAMRADTPGETALNTNLRLEQAGYSSELWAPCDKNKFCRQLGQPDGPVYSKITDYDKWTEHPPLTYQNRQMPVLGRYNSLAATEIVPSRQTVARTRPSNRILSELVAVSNHPTATKFLGDASRAPLADFTASPGDTTVQPPLASSINPIILPVAIYDNKTEKFDSNKIVSASAEAVGIKITDGGLLIKFELIIFFIFLVLIGLVYRRFFSKKKSSETTKPPM